MAAKPEMQEQRITAADGGVFGLTRVSPAENVSGRGQVIYIPGMFSGRSFWLSDKGIGLAACMAEAGYAGWIVERRGMGLAGPVTRRGPRQGLVEHIRYDLPLVQKMVAEQGSGPVYWVGHSLGGVVLTQAVAQSLDQQQVAGMVLFATQCEQSVASLTPPLGLMLKLAVRLLGRLPAGRFAPGPLDEPAPAVVDACDWTTAACRSPDFLAQLAAIKGPVLALVGAGDESDPPAGCRQFAERFGSEDRTFLVAGTETGFSEDFSHAGIVVSRAARQEIWPLFRAWVHRH